jgi:two-component system chemotaxis response regulator CheB
MNGRVEVTRGPLENGFRPAADPLFRTAAESHGPRVIGVVLSGGLNDGTYGLKLIKQHGGIAIAQRIEEAVVPSMPLSAIRNVEVDHVLGAREIAARLARLTRRPLPKGMRMSSSAKKKNRDVAQRGAHGLHLEKPPGDLAPFTCTECGGPLWESHDGELVRYACHVGHSFTAESLMQRQDDGIEVALWTAVRALEEKSALRRRMAAHARGGRLPEMARNYDRHAEESEHQANILREVLVDGKRRPRPNWTAANSVPRRPTRRKAVRKSNPS